MRPFLRLLFEIGPLVVFFVVNSRPGTMSMYLWASSFDDGSSGIFVATGAFMAAIAVAVPAAWLIERRIPVMPLVSGVFVLAFGGLTLYLEDETFIKLKPTIVNLLFSGILAGGLVFRTALLKPLFGAVFQLTEAGWRALTVRWCLFFVVLAVLNEVVWRTQTTELWIQFKLFGITPLTLIFSLAQLPLINRHSVEQDAARAE